MKKEYSEYLTNEQFRNTCKSQFDLVLRAIHLAEERVHAGRESGCYGTDNLATQVLADILKGPICK